MFFKKKTVRPEVVRSRRSSYLTLLLSLALGLALIIAFLNLVEVVKLVGAPFLVIPDALGILERVDKDETVTLTAAPGNRSFTVDLDRPGSYLIYLATWQSWETDPTFQVAGPDGAVRVEVLERGTRFYDTMAVSGYPEYRFEVSQAGPHTIAFRSEGRESGTFEASIVPDYITGNERAFNLAIWGQLFIILVVWGSVYYVRVLRPRLEADRRWADRGWERRQALDEFLDNRK